MIENKNMPPMVLTPQAKIALALMQSMLIRSDYEAHNWDVNQFRALALDAWDAAEIFIEVGHARPNPFSQITE